VLLTKSYWQTHTYPSLQPFNFLSIIQLFPLRLTYNQNSYYRMFVNFDLHRTVGTHDAIGSKNGF
jgi:hypothetical protein